MEIEVFEETEEDRAAYRAQIDRIQVAKRKREWSEPSKGSSSTDKGGGKRNRGGGQDAYEGKGGGHDAYEGRGGGKGRGSRPASNEAEVPELPLVPLPPRPTLNSQSLGKLESLRSRYE